MERRVKLDKEVQRELVLKAVAEIGSLKKLSENCDIPHSTFKKYSTGLLLFPENIFVQICKIGKVDQNSLNLSYLDPNWGRKLGSKIGMERLEKLYPDKISFWRKQAIKKSVLSRTKKIIFPSLNEEVAEFVGAYIGDGTLTKYFIRISGDHRYDIPYFNHVDKLVYKNFGIHGVIYRDKRSNTLYWVVFSSELCSFFQKEFGFKIGDKIRNNTLIPPIILKDSKLASACLRGLVDTDGCVSRRGRNGEQFSISLFSGNPLLIKQVKDFSDKLELFTYISKNQDEIGTNSKTKIHQYFSQIGSSNLRHIVRFYERYYNNRNLYQNEVAKFYQKDLYIDLNLPFKLSAP